MKSHCHFYILKNKYHQIVKVVSLNTERNYYFYSYYYAPEKQYALQQTKIKTKS